MPVDLHQESLILGVLSAKDTPHDMAQGNLCIPITLEAEMFRCHSHNPYEALAAATQ